ncbi:MAG TPA: hypothetical protein VJB14_10565 [Planctomycetota bacterium]|nr:hypothetical protein [Planctomycetota bacterium]
MKTMKRILTTALAAAALGGGLWTGMDAMKGDGCKPGIFPKSNETAGDFWNKRERHHRGTAVMAVRG